MFTTSALPAVARSILSLLLPATAFVALATGSAAALVYQDYKTNACSHALCSVTFAPAPANKMLQITSESCEFTTTLASKLVNAEIDVVSAGNVIVRDFLTPVLKVSSQTLGNVYAANNPTLLFVPKATGPNPDRPRALVTITGNDGETITCKISGQIIDP